MEFASVIGESVRGAEAPLALTLTGFLHNRWLLQDWLHRFVPASSLFTLRMVNRAWFDAIEAVRRQKILTRRVRASLALRGHTEAFEDALRSSSAIVSGSLPVHAIELEGARWTPDDTDMYVYGKKGNHTPVGTHLWERADRSNALSNYDKYDDLGSIIVYEYECRVGPAIVVDTLPITTTTATSVQPTLPTEHVAAIADAETTPAEKLPKEDTCVPRTTCQLIVFGGGKTVPDPAVWVRSKTDMEFLHTTYDGTSVTVEQLHALRTRRSNYRISYGDCLGATEHRRILKYQTRGFAFANLRMEDRCVEGVRLRIPWLNETQQPALMHVDDFALALHFKDAPADLSDSIHAFYLKWYEKYSVIDGYRMMYTLDWFVLQLCKKVRLPWAQWTTLRDTYNKRFDGISTLEYTPMKL